MVYLNLRMLLKLLKFRFCSIRAFSSLEDSAKNIVSKIEAFNRCQLELNWLVFNNVFLKIFSGVGGTEAMLFTNEIYRMYQCLALRFGWHWHPIQVRILMFN